MDIVIIGSGEVGHHLAEVLSKGEHRVSVIDSDKGRIRELQESLDVQAVEGDATVAEALTLAGVPKADLVVAATDKDLVNMLACTLSKKLGAKRVLLRVKDMARFDDFRFFYKGALGYDVLFSTEELAGEAVLRGLEFNGNRMGRNPPAHWFTTLRDQPRGGEVRQVIRERVAFLCERQGLKSVEGVARAEG